MTKEFKIGILASFLLFMQRSCQQNWILATVSRLVCAAPRQIFDDILHNIQRRNYVLPVKILFKPLLGNLVCKFFFLPYLIFAAKLLFRGWV